MCEVLDKMISEGYNKGISIGEANAKKKYDAQIAEIQAELAKYREALKQ